jgi:hypothetical protein
MIVKIESPNIVTSQVSCGNGTLVSTDEGNPIHGVKSATVRFAVDKAVTAELVVYAAVKTSAMATFVMPDPLTGQEKIVKRIEFGDGSVFEGE